MRVIIAILQIRKSDIEKLPFQGHTASKWESGFELRQSDSKNV